MRILSKSRLVALCHRFSTEPMPSALQKLCHLSNCCHFSKMTHHSTLLRAQIYDFFSEKTLFFHKKDVSLPKFFEI